MLKQEIIVGFYAFYTPTDYITNPEGYNLWAEARFGSNGVDFLPPELMAGTGSGAYSYERAMWDPDLADGLDSGTMPVSFEADLDDGTVGFDVLNGNSSPLDYDGEDSLGTIGSILIRAGAMVPGVVTWSNLSVTFWKDGAQQDTVNVGTAVADATTTETGAAEQIVCVTSDVLGCDRVTVSGAFRMEAEPDVYPGWADLFGQILIMPPSA